MLQQDTDNRKPRKKTPGPDWVRPRLLAWIGVGLVAVSTGVLAWRQMSAPPRTTPTIAAKSTPVLRHTEVLSERPAGTRRPTRGVPTMLTGRKDVRSSSSFHTSFVMSLAPELRKIGFRPSLLSRIAGMSGDPDQWTIRVPSNFPLLRVNAEITVLTSRLGGKVHFASQDSADLDRVTMRIGAGNTTTDVVVLQQEKRLKFKGVLAFIIDDLGYRPFSRARGFLELAQPLTLSILPDHEPAQRIARAALDAGKNVMLHLPMEPQEVSKQALEPKTIMRTMSDDDIRDLTIKSIAAIPGATGANNHMGSSGTEDPRVMDVVLEIVRAKQLFFVDSRTSPKSVAFDRAQKAGVLTATRQIFIDNRRETRHVIAEIRRAARIAAKNGQAIVIGHDRDETLAALALELPRLEAEGYRICMVSELVR